MNFANTPYGFFLNSLNPKYDNKNFVSFKMLIFMNIKLYSDEFFFLWNSLLNGHFQMDFFD